MFTNLKVDPFRGSANLRFFEDLGFYVKEITTLQKCSYLNVFKNNVTNIYLLLPDPLRAPLLLPEVLKYLEIAWSYQAKFNIKYSYVWSLEAQKNQASKFSQIIFRYLCINNNK